MQRGVLLLLIAMILTPGTDALSKIIGATQSPFYVAALRFLSAGIVAVVFAKLFAIPLHIPKAGRVGQVVRAALLAAATLCLVYALTLGPLAFAVGGFLIAPMVSTLLCVVFLGEAMTANRLIGAAMALIGAVVISEPATALNAGMIYALSGGAILGVYLTATRGAREAGHPLCSLAIQCFLGAALLAPFAIFTGPPVVDGSLFLFLPLGLVAATTHALTVAAYEQADAAVLAPFMYFNILMALLVGIVVFGEWPPLIALLGLCGIALGGVITAWPRGVLSYLPNNRDAT